MLVRKTGWMGEGVLLFTSKSNNLSLIQVMSIADFKLLSHNRYSVLNGQFVRQIHPSFFIYKLISIIFDSWMERVFKIKVSPIHLCQLLTQNESPFCSHLERDRMSRMEALNSYYDYIKITYDTITTHEDGRNLDALFCLSWIARNGFFI